MFKRRMVEDVMEVGDRRLAVSLSINRPRVA